MKLALLIFACFAISASQAKYLIGIEGYCLGTLCEDLRLDMVQMNLPNPIPPQHLFPVVNERSDKEEMALGRFSAFDSANSMYYLITVEQEHFKNFYELFVSNLKTKAVYNTTVKLWNTAVIYSTQWDPSSQRIIAVIDDSMWTIGTDGKVGLIGQIMSTDYVPRLPSAFDPASGNYFFSAWNRNTQLYCIVTYNIKSKTVIITPPIGGTDPIKAAYPLELAYIPTINQLYALTNSNMGGGIEKIDWQNGTWVDIVQNGHFTEPYDVDTGLNAENKNQEGCYDPVDNWWYLEMYDYSDPDMPTQVLYPWDVTKNKWASAPYSLSDDVSNWEFVSN